MSILMIVVHYKEIEKSSNIFFVTYLWPWLQEDLQTYPQASPCLGANITHMQAPQTVLHDVEGKSATWCSGD